VRYRHRQQIPPSAWEELGRELFGGAAEDDEGARLEPGGVEAPSGPRGYRSGSAVSDRELVRALDAHRWRVAATAAALGLSRTSLYRRMDACPEIRRASEITEQEIRSVLREQKGNVSAAASQLQVSPHGLKLRLAELASPEAPPDGP
jgi:transcriptional regulator of acetoin/glycerol metabolism